MDVSLHTNIQTNIPLYSTVLYKSILVSSSLSKLSVGTIPQQTGSWAAVTPPTP